MPRKDPAAQRAYRQERKDIDNQRRRERRAANPQKYRAYEQTRAPKRKAKKSLYMKARYQRKRDELLAYLATWRDANRPKIAADGQRRYAIHGESIRAQVRHYAQQNPEKIRARNATQRARKRGAPVNDLNDLQFLEIQAAQDHRCYYCKKRCKGRLTQDHLTPFAKNGSHTLHNVIAVCGSCNSRKGTKKPPVPVQPFLLTIAPSRKRTS